MTKLKTMILIVSLIMSPFAMASNESLELPIDLFKPTDWPDGIYLVFWEEIGDFFVATVETTHPTKEDLAKNNAVYSSAAEHQRLFVSLLGEQAVSEEEILSTESITAKVVSASGIRTATDEETKILLWIARRCGQYQPEVGYSDCKLLDEEQSTSPVFRSYWGQMPLVSENDRRRSRDMWQNLRARERYLRAKERNAAFSKRWKLPAFVILVLIVSLSHILALRGRKTTNDRSLNPPHRDVAVQRLLEVRRGHVRRRGAPCAPRAGVPARLRGGGGVRPASRADGDLKAGLLTISCCNPGTFFCIINKMRPPRCAAARPDKQSTGGTRKDRRLCPHSDP